MPFLPPNQQRQSTEGALTTKRYNTSTQMHKKHLKKEKRHSQYTSQQQFMCRRRKNLTSGSQKSSDEVLVWLSVWSEVQIVRIWSS